jgi:hypothetical protein
MLTNRQTFAGCDTTAGKFHPIARAEEHSFQLHVPGDWNDASQLISVVPRLNGYSLRTQVIWKPQS